MKSSPTLLIIAGTRPEIIKQAPLLWAAKATQQWHAVFVSTGQHRELGSQTLADLEITPDHSLDLMTSGQTPVDFLSSSLTALSRLITTISPDWIAVQGDTTSALAGALAGFYAQVPVLHVEAGLRTHDLSLPFPEEGHRQLITRVSSAHAAPTEAAVAMLRAEAVPQERIFMSGNTGIDCLLRTVSLLDTQSTLPRGLPDYATTWADGHKSLVLITLHRRESFGPTLAAMCHTLARVASEFPTTEFVLPVHPNPAVRDIVRKEVGHLPNFHLLEPLPYTACVWLMKRACFIVTDSGGLQEEGPALGKPVLVLRDVTERPEAITAGGALLLGCKATSIYSTLFRFLAAPDSWRDMARPRFPYGDGQAALRTLRWLAER